MSLSYRRLWLIPAVGILFGAGALHADFTYEETARITGGFMMGAMRMAGAFSKQAREPMKSTISVKGNRMLHATNDTISITDLDKETITTINHKNKTWSVITFQQMIDAMNKASQDMKGDNKADVNMNLSVKDTGQSKVIQGFNTQQKVMTFEIEGTDPKTGQKGNMVVTMDMWLTQDVKGYDEVRSFYERMAKKMGTSMLAGGVPNPMMARSDMQKAMAKAAAEGAKLNGVPVYEVISMGSKLDPETQAKLRDAQAKQQQAEQQSQQQQKQQQASAPTNAGEAAAQAIAGRLGRLGGFGRKKKTEDPPAQTSSSAPAPAATSTDTPPPASASSSSSDASLMEMTRELTSFSSASVDSSKFDVPAGYKQVDSEMLKYSNRGR